MGGGRRNHGEGPQGARWRMRDLNLDSGCLFLASVDGRFGHGAGNVAGVLVLVAARIRGEQGAIEES